MDGLKALLAKKRKEVDDLGGGGENKKKFVKRGDIEAARLAKLREEEDQENAAKV